MLVPVAMGKASWNPQPGQICSWCRVALKGHGFKACPEPVEGCRKDRKISRALAPEGLFLPLYHQEKCSDHFGWSAHFAAINDLASSQRTCEQLGWEPKQPGLISDLDHALYFET
jgi:hypothetical protein